LRGPPVLGQPHVHGAMGRVGGRPPTDLRPDPGTGDQRGLPLPGPGQSNGVRTVGDLRGLDHGAVVVAVQPHDRGLSFLGGPGERPPGPGGPCRHRNRVRRGGGGRAVARHPLLRDPPAGRPSNRITRSVRSRLGGRRRCVAQIRPHHAPAPEERNHPLHIAESGLGVQQRRPALHIDGRWSCKGNHHIAPLHRPTGRRRLQLRLRGGLDNCCLRNPARLIGPLPVAEQVREGQRMITPTRTRPSTADHEGRDTDHGRSHTTRREGLLPLLRLKRIRWEIAVPLVLYLAFTLVPFYWLLLYSIRPTGTTGVMPWPLTLEHYDTVWNGIGFGTYFVNSVRVGIAALVCTCLVALAGGYALARYNFRGKGFFLIAMLGTQFIPGAMML